MLDTRVHFCSFRHGLSGIASRFFVAIGLIYAFGCGQSGTPEYSVRGTVTYQGKALKRGSINFFPEKGGPIGGPIREDGTFEYQLPEGKYRVAIRANTEVAEDWKEGSGPPANFKSLLPPAYSRPDTSGLTVTVQAQNEPKVCDFHLK
ncbi:MAG: hypothetical protein JW829_05005 [Pirellulales bacterium]|nr:hypothetical protein [Pirellulales bacterium]